MLNNLTARPVVVKPREAILIKKRIKVNYFLQVGKYKLFYRAVLGPRRRLRIILRAAAPPSPQAFPDLPSRLRTPQSLKSPARNPVAKFSFWLICFAGGRVSLAAAFPKPRPLTYFSTRLSVFESYPDPPAPNQFELPGISPTRVKLLLWGILHTFELFEYEIKRLISYANFCVLNE